MAREAAVLAEVRREIARMRGGQRLGPGPEPVESSFDAAVRAVFAHLTEAPANWHQAVVYFAAGAQLPKTGEEQVGQDPLPRMMKAAVLMVVGQVIVASGVQNGTVNPSCRDSDQCMQGTMCHSDNMCEYCGEGRITIQTAGTCTFRDDGQFRSYGIQTVEDPACMSYNYPNDPNFVGYNLSFVAEVCASPHIVPPDGWWLVEDTVTWCEQCVFPIDGAVDQLSEINLSIANIASMSPSDVVALIFATLVVSFAVVGELKDITLCDMAIAQAGDKISPNVRRTLRLLGAIRRVRLHDRMSMPWRPNCLVLLMFGVVCCSGPFCLCWYLLCRLSSRTRAGMPSVSASTPSPCSSFAKSTTRRFT